MLLKSLFLSILLSIGLLGPAMAGPEQQERAAWCQNVAENAKDANDARNAGMPKETFVMLVMNWYGQLVAAVQAGVITEKQATELIEGALEGWDSQLDGDAVAMKVFKDCMNRKDI